MNINERLKDALWISDKYNVPIEHVIALIETGAPVEPPADEPVEEEKPKKKPFGADRVKTTDGGTVSAHDALLAVKHYWLSRKEGERASAGGIYEACGFVYPERGRSLSQWMMNHPSAELVGLENNRRYLFRRTNVR